MESLVYRPSISTKPLFERWLDSAEEDFFRVDPTPESLAPRAQREVDFHMMLLQNYIVTDPSVSMSKYTAIQQKILLRAGEKTAGRPKLFRTSRHNQTYRRAVRNWLLDKLVATALGAEHEEPAPPEPAPDLFDVEYEPVESLEMILRFEYWSKQRLPHRAYILHTREDRAILVNKSPELRSEHEELGVKCLKFEEYVVLRKNKALCQRMSSILQKHYFPPPELRALSNESIKNFSAPLAA